MITGKWRVAEILLRLSDEAPMLVGIARYIDKGSFKRLWESKTITEMVSNVDACIDTFIAMIWQHITYEAAATADVENTYVADG